MGTSGWSYPRGAGRWSGVFYPSKLAAKDELPFYAQYFDVVELNSSFYRPPGPGVPRAWAERTPEHFRFTAKLWQKFTHPHMFEASTGRPATADSEDVETFLRGMEPLQTAGKLGPVLAQFPPSFRPDGRTLDYLHDLIGRLMAEEMQVALELRHSDWTDSAEANALQTLLKNQGVSWVMIDEPRFSSSIGRVPLTSKTGYFRFHGRNWQDWWRSNAGEERYNYLYSLAEGQRLAANVRRVAETAQETYAFYNNHYGAKAVVNALQLKLALGESTSALALPGSLRAAFPALEELLQ